MTALIATLIDKLDAAEVIEDQIAAILAIESANQQTLATAALKDPRLWALRIFVGRTNPWSEFQNDPNQLDATPIVNVGFDSATYDQSGSNTVERQKTIGLFNIDCYGYGVSASNNSGGHDLGDETAAAEAMRAVRLVRNILMSAAYTYLGLRGTVWQRWPQNYQTFTPAGRDGLPVEQVSAARLAMQVVFNEFSPQFDAQTLDTVSVQVKRLENGQVVLTETLSVP